MYAVSPPNLRLQRKLHGTGAGAARPHRPRLPPAMDERERKKIAIAF